MTTQAPQVPGEQTPGTTIPAPQGPGSTVPVGRGPLQTLLLGAGFGVAFLLGQWFAPATTAGGDPGGTLQAQGRGPVNAPVNPNPLPPDPNDPARPVAEPFPYSEGSGGGAGANGFVAVTGSYGIGTSVLYLIDTVNRQLAVYEARGGAAAQRRVVLVGARRIDLDLELRGYNDRSEYDYAQLEKLFDKRGGKDRKLSTGLEADK